MPIDRNFSFPISTLTREAKRFHTALIDATVGPAVARRLAKKNPDATKPATEFAPLFKAQIDLVENGSNAKSNAIGAIGTMTLEQIQAMDDIESLLSGARRSAALAFPKNDVLLRSEFQVGIHEPHDFASEMERACTILAACQTHADDLDDHGWLEEDTTALGELLELLDGGDTEHEAAKDQKKGYTKARNLAASALYKMCLSVQNAARLAYPANKAATDETILVARDRYLLNEFPPRQRDTDKSEAEETPPTP